MDNKDFKFDPKFNPYPDQRHIMEATEDKFIYGGGMGLRMDHLNSGFLYTFHKAFYDRFVAPKTTGPVEIDPTETTGVDGVDGVQGATGPK